MANQFNPGTNAKVQTLFNAIRTALNNVDFDFSFSPGFRLVLEVDPDGRTVTVTSKPGYQGQNNAFGPPDASGHLTRVPALIIDAANLP